MDRMLRIAASLLALILGAVLWRTVTALTLPLTWSEGALILGLVFAATLSATYAASGVSPKAARLGNGAQARQLGSIFADPKRRGMPWFLLLGESGAGKSMLLEGAGLKLVDFSGPVRVMAHGDALVIEIPGRLTLPDRAAETEARAIWLTLLKAIRGAAKGQAPAGVLIATEATRVASDSDEDMTRRANGLRARLSDIHDVFGGPLDVSVLVTKLDRLRGGLAVLRALPEAARRPVFGVTLAETGPQDEPPSDLIQLLHRLADRVLVPGQDQGPMAARLNFAHQIGGLAAPLDDYVRRLVSRRYRDLPVTLRGIYGTATLDTGIAPEGVFSTDLLRNRLPGAVTLPPPRVRPGAWGAAALVVVCLGAGLALGLDVFRHWRALGELDRVLEAAQAGPTLARSEIETGDLTSVLGHLDQLALQRRVLGDLVADQGRLGRAVADARPVTVQAEAAYRRAVAQVLHPRLVLWAKERLAQSIEDGDSHATWRATRIYLSLLDPAAPGADRAAIDAGIDRLWSQTSALAADRLWRQRVKSHLAVLYEPGVAMDLVRDSALIAASRRVVAATPLAAHVYGDVLQSVEIADAAAPNLADAPALALFRGGTAPLETIPPLFAPEIYWSQIVPLAAAWAERSIGRPWSMGEAPDVAALTAAVLTLYLDDYRAAWAGALAQMDVAITSAGQNPAEALQGADGEIIRIVQRVAAATDLAAHHGVDAVTEDLLDVATGPAQALRDAFAPWQAAAGGPILTEFAGHMAALERAAEQVGADLEPQIQAAATAAQALPAPADSWGRAILREYRRSAWPKEVQAFSQILATRVLPMCEDVVAPAFPFGPGAELPLVAFQRYFGAQGLVQSTVDLYLAEALEDDADDGLRVNPEAPLAAVLTPRFLAALEQTRAIRQVYFDRTGAAPEVVFDVDILSHDPALGDVTLEVFGTPVTERAVATWPGSDPSIRLQGGGAVVAFEGDWALASFLLAGQVTAGDAYFDVRHSLGGYDATIRFRFDRGGVPFWGASVAPILCPIP